MTMKRINLVVLTVMACAVTLMVGCKGEKAKKYAISGNVPSQVEAKWIYLYTIRDNEPVAIDSTEIENTAFKFKGTVPDTLSLVVLHPGTFDEYPAVGWTLILEEGDIVVDSAEQFVSGTPLNDGLKDWMGSLMKIMMGGTPDDIKGFFREHWSEHSEDFVGSFVLYNCAGMLDFPFVDSLTVDVPKEVREISLLKPFFEQIENTRKMQAGNMFTDIKLAYIDETPMALSEIIGKGEWVLVDFWASWCGPCRQAMPELQSTVKKYKSLKVYGIAVSDEPDNTRRAIKDLNITWPVIIDKEAESAKTYGIQAIPAMILFAPDGTIAARDFTVSSLEEMLEEKVK